MLALAGALAAVAAALFFFMMARAQPPAVDTAGSLEAERAAVAERSKPAAAPAPAAKKPAATPAAKKPAAKAAPKAAAPAKPVVERKPTPPKPVEPVNGLPLSVSKALDGRALVIVSLYVPGARVDALAAAEAQAAAKALGVGFVKLDVLNEDESRPLVEKLGVLQNPSILVYDSRGELRARLEGFVDRQTVAQAAVSASGRS